MRVGQATVKRAVQCEGVGLHSGTRVALSFLPAPPGHGIRIRRTDVAPGTGEVPADLSHVVDSRLATTIGNRHGVTVGTVEHLMAALAGTGIDNLVVTLDGPEVPAMDGSAAPFVELIECAGIEEQAVRRRAIRLLRPVAVERGEASITMTPADSLSIDFRIEFAYPAIACQSKAVELVNGTFVEDIAPARTFGLVDEILRLQKAGLARGASLDNAIAVGRSGAVTRDGLRFDDEFVRHKILDCFGDLYLAGAPILARVVAVRSGHATNHAVLRALFADPDNWTWSDIPRMSAPPIAGEAPAAALAIA